MSSRSPSSRGHQRYVAVTYLIGHDYPKAQADMKRVPRSWVPVLGTFFGIGIFGLPAGFAVPALGVAAAVGLVLYFVGALVAHLRVGSGQLIGWAVFFTVAVAALAVNPLSRCRHVR